MKITLLVADDDQAVAHSLQRIFERCGYEALLAYDGAQAKSVLEKTAVDVALLDLNMPHISGMELLTWIKLERPDLPVIVITGQGDIAVAVEAIKKGAFDFLSKPFPDPELLLVPVRHALEYHQLARRVEELQRNAGRAEAFENIIGTHPKMRAIYALIEDIRQTDVPVLISGESGTGKELVARAIHRRSLRREGPFVIADCAAFTESLIDSELFGHVRGAFTGAHHDRVGFFQAAHRGTLFLDEVGELSLATQSHLLRALQSGEIRRVGSPQTSQVDVRVICATNRDLKAEIEKGRFREDLYYRINPVPIAMPPLRERKGDIIPLAMHFLRKFALSFHKPVNSIDPAVLALMETYNWPGNVRELENMIERGVALAREQVLTMREVPAELSVPIEFSGAAESPRPTAVLTHRPYPEAKERMLAEFSRQYAEQMLNDCRGNVSEAARRAGMDRTNFKRLLKKWKIAKGDEKIT